MPIPPIAITTFGGEIPAVDDRLLPENQASEAVNAWLFSGRVEPVHALVPLHVMRNPAARSWFRRPKGSSSIDYMADSDWLEFENVEVRVIRSPTPNQDDDGRFYWADGVYPKMMTGNMIESMSVGAPVQHPIVRVPGGGTLPATTIYYSVTATTAFGETTPSAELSVVTSANDAIRISWDMVPNATGYRVYRGVNTGALDHYFVITGGSTTTYLDTGTVAGIGGSPPSVNTAAATPRQLGIPAPEVAPGVTPSGGASTTNVTVSYVYTWVSDLGEEGPPSPATTVSNKIDALYHITMTAPTSADTTNRNLTKTRIYRTIVSAQGVPSFYFVTELPITTLTYDDNHATNTDAIVVNNEQLTSTAFAGPPTDLQGFTGMPNGFLAGFRFNEVWFSEPYLPHAWPPAYVIAVEGNIVGLGVYLQSLIILTEGQPYAATGNAPDTMSLDKIQPLEACTSRLSIVNTPNGTLYCSPNGLINITPSGAVNLSLQLITKDKWADLLHLDTVTATVISQGYYAYSGPTQGVFQADSFQSNAFQQESAYGKQPGAYISLVDGRQGVVILDPDPSEVFNLMQDEYNGETMILRDGVVYLVDLRSLQPYAPYRWRSKIFTMPYLQNLGAAKVYWTPPETPAPTVPSYFRVFAGDHAQAIASGLPLRFEQQMTASGQMFRLPSGYKALYYQFEVEGEVIVNAIHCAQTAKELRLV